MPADAGKIGGLRLANLTAQKIENRHSRSELEVSRADISPEQLAPEGRSFIPRHPIRVGVLPRAVEDDTSQFSCTCATCPAHELNLCAAVRKKTEMEAGAESGIVPLVSSEHTIPARRMICHPKEWTEYVSFICHGWAASSITLPDGRRQILSFLLPGDVVSAAYLLEPVSGHSVEAITEVTYRKFKRSDFKALLFAHHDLLEKFSRTWNEERYQADQLALDLGRRTADERIARLILNLADKLAKRGMMRGQTMVFPLRQRQIADATGLTPVHVSKVLGEFQRAGLIEISSRSLTIVNCTELRRTADWR